MKQRQRFHAEENNRANAELAAENFRLESENELLRKRLADTRSQSAVAEGDVEVELRFHVPDTDFDGITVEVGLKAIQKAIQEARASSPLDEPVALGAAYLVLKCVYDRYVETIGLPLRSAP